MHHFCYLKLEDIVFVNIFGYIVPVKEIQIECKKKNSHDKYFVLQFMRRSENVGDVFI